MKSQYAKFVKHLEKSEKVYFQRLGNDCTIEIYPVILEERLLKCDIQKLAETIH